MKQTDLRKARLAELLAIIGERPRTVETLARATGYSLKLVYDDVTLLLTGKCIEVCGSERSEGRPRLLYRVADAQGQLPTQHRRQQEPYRKPLGKAGSGSVAGRITIGR